MYITQDKIAPTVREVLGIPLGNSTVQKWCAPSDGRGPPVAMRLGTVGRGGAGRPLYERDAVLAWARSLLRPASEDDRPAA